jgi:hypothetical protein
VAPPTALPRPFVIHTKQEPYRTYAISADVWMDDVADVLYWDTAHPTTTCG